MLFCKLSCVSLDTVSLHLFFFFNQKTAYEMRISDWSSDVCSSDLQAFVVLDRAEDAGAEQAVPLRLEGAIVDRFGLLDLPIGPGADAIRARDRNPDQIGRASCRERVCQYV